MTERSTTMTLATHTVTRAFHSASAVPPMASQAARIRVLVVDDCPVNRLLACAALSQWGISPKIACNGEEAVRLACEQSFDLILMDLTMPVMDGFAATRAIRRFERARPFRPAVPVVAYTAEDMPMRDALLHRSGLNGWLSKPCDQLTMTLCLERWCAGLLAE